MSLTLVTIAQQIAATLLGYPKDYGKRETALYHLKLFAEDSNRQGIWASIKKEDFCARMKELINEPWVLDQKKSKRCMAVTPIFVFLAFFPARFTAFAVSIFETGEGRLGSTSVKMQRTLAKDALKPTNKTWKMDLTDMKLTLVMREMQNGYFDIDTMNDAVALSPGGLDETMEPIEKSGLFDVTQVERTVAAVKALSTDTPSFVIITGPGPSFNNGSVAHAGVILPTIEVKNERVTYELWSWGTSEGVLNNSKPSAQGWRKVTVRSWRFEQLYNIHQIHPKDRDGIPNFYVPPGADMEPG
mgnify:CR=1 FL=1